MSPVWTRISRIWPVARDFTSTTRTGSIVPAAIAETVMLRRSTGTGS